MRFLDSNVFLHSFLIPRRTLTEKERLVKEEAKAIVKGVEDGEGVATTTVHVSEVVNLIEAGLSLEQSLGFLAWIIASGNIKVYPVALEDYESALPVARENHISVNDALAYLLMKKHRIKEIYSFDRHMDRLKDITRL
ncbi:MAG: type II toxin-antitoxin system VapC family toxin, partial [Candidatus Bathyarchaeia archaeon]